MKLGLILNSQFLPDQDPVKQTEQLVEQVRACREGGFDAIYCIQHFLSDPFQAVQLWPLLGRLAAESGEMRLGSSIFLLTLFNPVYAAEHVVAMDVITGGKFVFGVGLGFRDEEFEAFGVDTKTRAARFNESMDLVVRLLNGEEVTHEGKFFKLTKARVFPRPVQQPHPPIWMAASGDLGVKRAARHGVSWLINPHATIATVRQQMDLFNATLAENGKPAPTDVPIFRELAIGTSYENAREFARPYLEQKYAAYADWGLDKPMPEHESLSLPFDELARDRFIIGSADDCLEQLNRYEEELGATHVLARIQWPGMPHEDAMRQIEMLGEQVIPALRSAER